MSWKSYKLGELLERKRVKVEIKPRQEYNLVTIRLWHQGVILREQKKGEEIKSNMYQVNTGDFVLSGIDARNGAFGIVPKELDGAVVTNDFWCLEPKKHLLRKDFFLFLTSTKFFDYICNQCSDGTTQRIRLQKDKFYDFEIALPPIEEQGDVVESLAKSKSSNEILSTELTHQLDLVKQLRQAFLREAMQGQLVPQDPKDEPASVLLEKIKAEKERLVKEKKIKKQKPLPPITEDEIPFEIPENWVWCRLGELTTYGSSPKAEPTDLKDNTWVLDLEDIEKETSVLLQKIRFDERNSLSTKSKFEAGDVLYSKLRPYLDKVIVADEAGVCTTEILPLKCYAGFVPEFFRWTLKRPDFIQHVNSLTKGMKMPRLGTKEGELALIPVPPLSEQQRIVAKLDELMRYCDELEASIKESQQQNELLLQQVLREALEPKSIEEKEEELAIAAEPQAKYEKGKVIALKPTNVDYYKRSVLAAEIVWQLHKEPTLGHLKLQKLIYLCQKTGDMQLPTNFLRQAMGPYDNRLMRSIDKQLKQKKWFEYQKDQVFKYQPLEKAGQHHKDFLKYFSEEREDIQFIIDKFKTVKSDIVEIVATLYACLDNMLNEKIIFSEALLLQRFYEWSEEKKKFSDKEVKRVFLSMKDTGIIPRGYNF